MATVIPEPMLLDKDARTLLRGLRADARFSHRSPTGEPERLFRSYAAGLLAQPDFGAGHYSLLTDAHAAITGGEKEELDDARWFEDIGTRALILAANGDWLTFDRPEALDVWVPADDEILWIEDVARMKPTEHELKHEGSLEGKVEILVGAKVSSKTTLTSSTKLPPGGLNRIDLATLVVTDHRILLVGHEGVDIEYSEIIGLSVMNPRTCRLNRRNAEGDYLQGRSGALLCAVINSGVRRATHA